METVAYQARLIGKESRHLGTGRDILTPPEFSDYGGDDEWPDVLQTLQRLVRDQHLRASLFEESGLGTREFEYVVSGKRIPRQEARTRMTAAIARAAREELRRFEPFHPVPRGELEVIAMFLATIEPSRCLNCGKPLEGRQRKWCSDDAMDGCRGWSTLITPLVGYRAA